MADKRYSSNVGAIYSLKYHIIWCPKYRRKVLVDGVDDALKSLILQKAKELKIEIKAMEVMPDHVHLFISADPTEAPQRVVAQLKGFTSHELRERFPILCSKLPTMWSRSYFIASVGSVTEEAIRKYIEDQKGR